MGLGVPCRALLQLGESGELSSCLLRPTTSKIVLLQDNISGVQTRHVPFRICLNRGLPENTLSLLNSGTSAGEGEFLLVLGALFNPETAGMSEVVKDSALLTLCLASGERLGETGTLWFSPAAFCSPKTRLTDRGEGWR